MMKEALRGAFCWWMAIYWNGCMDGSARRGFMEIHEIRPGMTCLTREGTAYVLEVDRQSLVMLLQREDETIPVQVRSDDILGPIAGD